MEMQTSSMPQKARKLTVDEDALVSQVLEIIGGITVEEPEERDVWSVEEGDDSVFSSDEEQAHRDIKANASCGLGDSECECLKTADAKIPDSEEDSQSIPDKETSEPEREMSQHTGLTETDLQEIQIPNPEAMDQSEAADPGTQPVQAFRESSLLKCKSADVQLQPERGSSAENGKTNVIILCLIRFLFAECKTDPPIFFLLADLPVEKKDFLLDALTPKLHCCDVPNEESSVKGGFPQQTSGAKLKISGNEKLQVDHEPERDLGMRAPVGFHQNRSLGYSTLPLPKKSKQQESFDHLTSSKYSTVSYRKICRGNTRQKIQKFEFLMMNL